MNRDEMVEAGVRAARKSGGFVDGMDAILDAVEPLIRADERALIRAKVESLVVEAGDGPGAIQQVLDLIDGLGE